MKNIYMGIGVAILLLPRIIFAKLINEALGSVIIGSSLRYVVISIPIHTTISRTEKSEIFFSGNIM